MFVSVRQLGSARALRLRSEAVAYLAEDGESCCIAHLIGGEIVRLAETVAEVEALLTGEAAPAPRPAPTKSKRKAS